MDLEIFKVFRGWFVKKPVFIFVRESDGGFECSVDMDCIKRLKIPHQKQLKAFLDEISKGL